MLSLTLRKLAGVAVTAIAVLLMALPAHATKLKRQNLTQLITQSEAILAGTVTSVTDGLDGQGVPYTEITIAVGSSAKGKVKSGAEYTFRQFGLLAPRTAPSGRRYLAVTPEGFPRWNEGEYVVAFMYKPAARTGLRTTAGLAQGKLTQVNGQLVNQFDNQGLFEDVRISPSLLNDEERAMLNTHGAVDASVFMGLVGRAVTEGWIENGEMN